MRIEVVADYGALIPESKKDVAELVVCIARERDVFRDLLVRIIDGSTAMTFRGDGYVVPESLIEEIRIAVGGV